MNYELTAKTQYSHHDNDGKDRNYILYFLNGVLILKQKIPFDTHWEPGFDRRTAIYDEYILNNKLYQTRKHWLGCSHPNNDKMPERKVSYPLSRKIISKFGIPKDLKIELK